MIDEQHRFGVYQRMVFSYKGKRPSILVMSATPIPRTLALASYGDMDESRLTEKPLGRKTIKTTSLTLNKVNKLIERIKINITNSKRASFPSSATGRNHLLNGSSHSETMEITRHCKRPYYHLSV